MVGLGNDSLTFMCGRCVETLWVRLCEHSTDACAQLPPVILGAAIMTPANSLRKLIFGTCAADITAQSQHYS